MQDTLRFIPSAQGTSIYLEKNSDFLLQETSYRNQAFSFNSFSELFPQAENARGRELEDVIVKHSVIVSKSSAWKSTFSSFLGDWVASVQTQ